MAIQSTDQTNQIQRWSSGCCYVVKCFSEEYNNVRRIKRVIESFIKYFVCSSYSRKKVTYAKKIIDQYLNIISYLA